jgi:hypothetical protein
VRNPRGARPREDRIPVGVERGIAEVAVAID